jgi:predicted solute-binding protein
MLTRCDAALIIGDNALFQSTASIKSTINNQQSAIEKIDLGDAWTTMTGLPFVWAFWAGRPDALSTDDVKALQHARDEGVERPEELARSYLAETPERQLVGARYLRENIKYYLGEDERAALGMFYRYAVEAGVVSETGALRFYGQL